MDQNRFKVITVAPIDQGKYPGTIIELLEPEIGTVLFGAESEIDYNFLARLFVDFAERMVVEQALQGIKVQIRFVVSAAKSKRLLSAYVIVPNKLDDGHSQKVAEWVAAYLMSNAGWFRQYCLRNNWFFHSLYFMEWNLGIHVI